jgi:carboxylesterase
LARRHPLPIDLLTSPFAVRQKWDDEMPTIPDAASLMIREECRLARLEGVTREENLPFLFDAGRSTAGALLVHGFTATPREMRALGNELAAAGYRVLGVRLPGHGTTPEDLAGRRYEEWLAAVERGYLLLADSGPVYGIGMSSGALLLLALAESRALAGLVLLSPYMRLRHRLAPAAALLRFILPYQEHSVAPELRPYYYGRRPVNGVYQLQRLIRRVRLTLPRITAPTLAVNALGDRTVCVSSAQKLFRRLGCRHREYHLYGPDVPHILTTDENPRRTATFRLVTDFLGDLEGVMPGV